MLVFLLILVGGMTFFLAEYSIKAPRWVTFKGSPHVYQGSANVSATVTDRDGVLLLDTTDGRNYGEDPALRQAALHWLGDRNGSISATALNTYASALVGYDSLHGIYHYTQAPGTMELTLSSRVQTSALKAMKGRKGVVAVYNYKTGQILCALSTPTFDPDNVPDIAGDTNGNYEGVYLNRFTQVTYPPGSIFKIVTTAAALDGVEGILDMTFTCDGIYELQGSRVTCEKAHGTLNLKNAMARSCNCSFAQIAQLIGSEKLAEYARQFGITGRISFDGITTAEGNFDLTGADKVALAWSAIGQYTDMVNPCAYLTFMGAIGAGGRGAVPYIVEQVTAGEEITYQAETILSDRVMEDTLAQTLTEYMRNNVETIYGAGNFPGLTVCAKSGTSELGGDKTPNAMFSGFVADEEYPLAFIVVVENGGYGSHTCVPILSAVLAECKAVLDGR
jgi:peptidoglycan glycosyltransferase